MPNPILPKVFDNKGTWAPILPPKVLKLETSTPNVWDYNEEDIRNLIQEPEVIKNHSVIH